MPRGSGVWPCIKKTADRGATLVFSDESGFLLLPLVRRTLARRGNAAPLVHRARHRDKVSVAAALLLSPCQGHVNLHYQTYPNGYVNVEIYARFLRGLLRRTGRPVVLVHDRGNMHRGDPIRELMSDFPRRLDLNLLPPYAPELNPVEQLWNFAKDKELSNFVPHSVAEANAGVTGLMEQIRHDQHRLLSFYRATPLQWDPLTVFFLTLNKMLPDNSGTIVAPSSEPPSIVTSERAAGGQFRTNHDVSPSRRASRLLITSPSPVPAKRRGIESSAWVKG